MLGGGGGAGETTWELGSTGDLGGSETGEEGPNTGSGEEGSSEATGHDTATSEGEPDDSGTGPSTSTGSCGDGIKDEEETCDDSDFGGVECSDYGFASGELECAADCSAVGTAGCWTCGNGTREASEACDSDDLGGETCETQGFDGGQLSCAADCTSYDTTACTAFECGNDLREGSELCDGSDLGGHSCSTVGPYDGGTLGCAANCASWDVSGCTSPTCVPNGGYCTTHEDCCPGPNFSGCNQDNECIIF